MKRHLMLIGLAALLPLALPTQAQTNPPDLNALQQFFANNPTNLWDVTGYGLYNTTGQDPVKAVQHPVANRFGGGSRIGYWITPSVGAALDASYCDSSWTFASVGLVGRGTIILPKDIGSITPQAEAGPGWNISGQGRTVVAQFGGGVTVNLKFMQKVGSLFLDYNHVTTTPIQQDRLLFGLTRRF